MSCSCSATSNTYIPRRYMRIDGLIFDKKYISKLEFDGDILTLFRKGDCHPFKYKMYSEKTKAQIAEYLLELNTCGSEQVELSTDDHSKLINLDLEGQHPIDAVAGLQEALDLKESVENVEKYRSELEETKLNKPTSYIYENLPNPEDFAFSIVYVLDKNCLAFSDGTSWKQILLGDF